MCISTFFVIVFMLLCSVEVEKPTIKNQSLELVATYLHSSCDQPEVYTHQLKLFSLAAVNYVHAAEINY